MEKILEGRKRRSQKSSVPFRNFIRKIDQAASVLAIVESYPKSRNCIAEARKQFIISLVTAFEVYIGDLITEVIDKRSLPYSTRLLSDLGGNNGRKYKLADVVELIKEEVTPGELICSCVNFQNIPATSALLTSLLDQDFIELIKEYRFEFFSPKINDWVSISIRRDFFLTLEKLLEERHKCVHQIRFNETPTNASVKRYLHLIQHLVMSIDILMEVKLGRKDVRIKKK